MKEKRKVRGELRIYLQWPILLSALVVAMNLVVGMLSAIAGLVMFGFTAVYVAIALWLYFYRKRRLLAGLVEFSSDYSWVQKHLLSEMNLPYALADENLIAALHSVKNSFNSYTLDRLALAGAAGALSEPDYLRQTAEKIIATRARTTAALRAMGFQVADSAANFLFVSHPAVAAKTLLDGLRARGILVRWWDRPRISNHLRITVGTDGEMDALLSALEELVP